MYSYIQYSRFVNKTASMLSNMHPYINKVMSYNFKGQWKTYWDLFTIDLYYIGISVEL